MDTEFPFKVINMLEICGNEQLCNNTKNHWVNMYIYLGIFSFKYTENNPSFFLPLKFLKWYLKIHSYIIILSFNLL